MPAPLIVSFVGGRQGLWAIDRIDVVAGEGLPIADRLLVAEGSGAAQPEVIQPEAIQAETIGAEAPSWTLRAATGNIRYTNRGEMNALGTVQAPLSRPQATRAALIPIRKRAAWWDLAQDERRHIFEEQSHHIAVGLEYLPGVARRLHHCRELGEPFDFLTWFEYAPEDETAFDDLVARLRDTREWGFVDREVDIRLSRAG